MLTYAQSPAGGLKWKLHCPPDTMLKNDKGRCGAMVNYKLPVVSNSSYIGIVLSQGQRTGTFFNVGSMFNTYIATDNTDAKQECSFTVKVVDTEKPTFICPRDTVIRVESNEKGVKYSYKEPTATDNCGDAKDIKQTAGLKSGSIFPIGINTITYTAKDDNGNIGSCSFKVTVTAGKAQSTTRPPMPGVALKSYGDSIRITDSEVINDCEITVFVSDDGIEDGDTVSIFFNGDEIVQQQRLKVNKSGSYKGIIALSLNLEQTGANTIIAKAWNVGAIPPNTMEIRVYAGNVLNKLADIKNMKPLLRRNFECFPGLTDGMSLKCK